MSDEWLTPSEVKALVGPGDCHIRLNPGLLAYQAARRAVTAENKRLELEWRAAWKADAPRRKRVACKLSGAKRRAAELQRTPAWADPEAIRAVYAEAERLTRETGEEYHVDHVIPLQGRLVSGLHVAGNLQILPAAENVKKSNRYDPC